MLATSSPHLQDYFSALSVPPRGLNSEARKRERAEAAMEQSDGLQGGET